MYGYSWVDRHTDTNCELIRFNCDRRTSCPEGKYRRGIVAVCAKLKTRDSSDK